MFEIFHQTLASNSVDYFLLPLPLSLQVPSIDFEKVMISSRPQLLVALFAIIGSLAPTSDAYQIPTSTTASTSRRSSSSILHTSDKEVTSSRRDILRTAAAAFVATPVVFFGPQIQPAFAAGTVEACPPRSSNCIRTTWTPPEGTSPSKASQTVKDVLNSYPQEGQANVDLNGWTIVEDQFDNVGGISRIEFRSGVGNFAKFLNGGKPFVDDVWIQVDPNTAVVEVKSSSRVGDSDLGVNQKRLQYFVQALRSRGWTAPEPSY